MANRDKIWTSDPKDFLAVLRVMLEHMKKETHLCELDMDVFGTGCLEYGPEVPGFVRRVAPDKIEEAPK